MVLASYYAFLNNAVEYIDAMSISAVVLIVIFLSYAFIRIARKKKK